SLSAAVVSLYTARCSSVGPAAAFAALAAETQRSNLNLTTETEIKITALRIIPAARQSAAEEVLRPVSNHPQRGPAQRERQRGEHPRGNKQAPEEREHPDEPPRPREPRRRRRLGAIAEVHAPGKAP